MSSYFVLALTAKKTPRSPQVLLLDALSASPCDIYSLNDPKAIILYILAPILRGVATKTKQLIFSWDTQQTGPERALSL